MSGTERVRSASSRREARERAVELLYEAEAKSAHPTEVIDALPIRPDEYAVELATGIADHMIEIDAVLGRHADRWPVSRMAAMDRMVLRLGVFELATKDEVPEGVCLSEAVELGGQYGSTDDTSKFVNGVLAAVAREVRGGSRPWTPIEAVVFDMDGVFRHWQMDPINAFEEQHGLDLGSVNAEAFAQPRFHRAMRGELTAEEWSAQIADALTERYPTLDRDAVVELWLSPSWTLDDGMVAVLQELGSAGVRRALYSNASTNLETDLAAMGIADEFDVVANSSRIGHMKPDRVGYETVAAMVGVAPEGILFIDDRSENVAGAVEAGWHAVLMQDVTSFRTALVRLGVRGLH